MKLQKTIAALVMLMVISGTSFGEILPVSTGGGSGGGSSASVPSISPTFREEIDFPGFRVSLYANNRQAGEETWEHDGHTHTEVWPKETYGSVDMTIEQSAFSLLPVSHEIEIKRYNDEGRLQVEMEFLFILVDDATGWEEPPSGGMGMHFGGLDVSTHSSIRHRDFWKYDAKADDWVEIMTEDIDGYGSFWIQEAETDDAYLNVREWDIWEDGEYYDGLKIEARFEVLLTGDEDQLAMANFMFEEVESVHLPEPGTMALLTIGGVAGLLRRRRRK